MALQIIDTSDRSFTSLISEEQLGTVTAGFHDTIAMSLALDGASPTQSEVKRRFNLCVEIFKQLRGDMKWGVTRILDHLPEYLRAELAGETWEPDERQCWISSDG